MKITGKVVRRADGVVTSAALTSLRNQLAAAIAEKAEQERLASVYQSYYDSKHDCGFLRKRPCNDWLDMRNAANAQVASLTAKIAELNKQIDAEVRRLNEETQRNIATNPELLKITTDASALATKERNKKLLIWGGIIAVVLLLIVITVYIIRKKKS